MQTVINRVEQAIAALKKGEMILLIDHPDRENEGDLVAPAETITAEQMNFMIRQGTGIVCVAMTETQLQTLELPLMVAPGKNTCTRGTQFTVSVDAKEGITTGVSASDRAHTVRTMVADKTTADDLVMPGHIFPLQAKTGGVLERPGHTEGSIDIVKLACFKPAAVICEIMNPDGSMAHGDAILEFAKTHQITVLSIADLIHYRLVTENIITEQASAALPLANYGDFTMHVVKDDTSGHEHAVLVKAGWDQNKPVPVRVHSSCVTGDLFASERCDCHQQLHHSLKEISKSGGILIYLQQEGRGIGLFNKIKAYALQEQGFDTVEANVQLGLPIDSRQYHIAATILRNMNCTTISLLTNNPAKIAELEKFGITVTRTPMPTFATEMNRGYLQTKQTKLDHYNE